MRNLGTNGTSRFGNIDENRFAPVVLLEQQSPCEEYGTKSRTVVQLQFIDRCKEIKHFRPWNARINDPLMYDDCALEFKTNPRARLH